MLKPHLRKIDGYWLCAGGAVIGYGITAKSAYEQWRVVSLSLAGRLFEDGQMYGMEDLLTDWIPKGMNA